MKEEEKALKELFISKKVVDVVYDENIFFTFEDGDKLEVITGYEFEGFRLNGERI